MVVACLALTVALSGASYAAVVLPRNSVGTQQLKRAAVRSSDIGRGAVTSPKIKDFSLLRRDFKSGQIPRGPTASAAISTDPANVSLNNTATEVMRIGNTAGGGSGKIITTVTSRLIVNASLNVFDHTDAAGR